MKAIISVQADDGSYPEVGMSGRTVLTARNLSRIHRHARLFAGSKAYRAEIFGQNVYGNPVRVEEVKSPPLRWVSHSTNPQALALGNCTLERRRQATTVLGGEGASPCSVRQTRHQGERQCPSAFFRPACQWCGLLRW
jgi:hypothetical protein